jgi:iron(III) transport system substrate-binding protein
MKQQLIRMSFALLLAVSGAPTAYSAESPTTGGREHQPQLAQAGWKEEWEKVLAAARKEGAVTIAGPPQAAERSVMQKFQKAYPGIKLEYTGLTNAQFMSRASTERNGGVYAWDIYIGGVSSGYRYVDQGFFQPIRSNLIDPELTDDSIWLGGFDAGFQDNAGKYMYAFTGYITNLVAVNRSVVPESQLNFSKDLLDPKWRGKIVIYDPRAGGAGLLALSALRRELGDDVVKTLMVDQKPILSVDKRQFTEWVVRGRYPIGIGVVDAYLAPFLEEGLGKDVKSLETGLRVMTSGSGNLHIMGRNPHPNAAKVFANWLLSKDTQADWAKTADTNSRRLDTPPGSPETRPDPALLARYANFNEEKKNDFMQETQDMAKKIRP